MTDGQYGGTCLSATRMGAKGSFVGVLPEALSALAPSDAAQSLTKAVDVIELERDSNCADCFYSRALGSALRQSRLSHNGANSIWISQLP